MGSVVLFAIFTWIAATQDGHPDPYRAPAIFSLDWWRYPIEENAVRALPLVQGDLLAVTSPTGSGKFWVVGVDGMILHSSDRGQRWTRQWIPADLPPRIKPPASAKFLAPTESQDKGSNPPAPVGDRSPPQGIPRAPLPTLRAVQFVSDKIGWVAGEGDYLLLTIDGGTTWTWKTCNTGENVISLWFLDPQSGWVGGDRGTLARTEDGGKTWTRLSRAIPFPCGSIRFQSLTTGWLLAGNRVYATSDGGARWSTVSDLDVLGILQGPAPHVLSQANAIARLLPDRMGETKLIKNPPSGVLLGGAFSDDTTGWIVGPRGTVLHTRDGGTTWEAQSTPVVSDLRSAAFSDSSLGCIVGSDGTLLRTLDGGTRWVSLSQGEPSYLFGLQPAGKTRVWTIDPVRGVLLRSFGEIRSEFSAKELSSSPESVTFLDPARAWVRLKNGEVAETRDGGARWQILGSYRRWIAPWYALSFLVVGGLLALGMKKPPPVAAAEESIANTGISDRPLEAKDRDFLGFGELALGLSRFLRNEKTEPPITIAVTGEWGTGKSSLMNLLREDLRSYGFRPVWFNAWHHQEEKNLLAALLQAVRLEATPTFPSPAMVPFKLKLLKRRFQDRLGRNLAFLLLFGLALGYLLQDPSRLGEFLFSLFQSAPQDGSVAKDPLQFIMDTVLPPLSMIVGGAGVTTFLRALRAFGLNPASLLALSTGNTKTSALDAQTSFRLRFAHEFNQVATALRPQTLTIFIDDLDRCRPENVVQVLEAVNFLVSSGPCVVVMGLAPGYIKKAIRATLKEVGEEFPEQYLEKLVNIEVPVPQPTPEQVNNLLVASSEPEVRPRAPSRWRTWADRLQASLPPLCAALVLASFLGFSWFGTRLPIPEVSKPQEEPGYAVYNYDQLLEPAPASDSSSPRNPDVLISTTRGEFIPGQENPIDLEFLVLPVILLAAIALGVFYVQPDVVVRDSSRFKEALALWNPLLTYDPRMPGGRSTPRTIKRFLNRVRYLAMIQRRAQEIPLNAWLDPLVKQLRSWMGQDFLRPPEQKLAQNAIPEDLLVGLSMVQKSRADWIQTPPTYLQFSEHVKKIAEKSPEDKEEADRLLAGVDQAKWDGMIGRLDHFKALGSSVRLW